MAVATGGPLLFHSDVWRGPWNTAGGDGCAKISLKLGTCCLLKKLTYPWAKEKSSFAKFPMENECFKQMRQWTVLPNFCPWWLNGSGSDGQKAPWVAFSTRKVFSIHGDPWVVCLDRVSGFLSKKNSGLQVGASCLPPHIPQILLSVHLHTCFFSKENASLSHISLSFMLQVPCHSLQEVVTGYFSPKEWPLIWLLLASYGLLLWCCHVYDFPDRRVNSMDWNAMIRRKAFLKNETL